MKWPELPPPLRKWWDRLWWLVPLALAFACLSVFKTFATPHLCYTKYWLSGDSGIAVYNSWQVADGRVIHQDFFEYRLPFYFFVHALLFKFTGPSPAAMQWATISCVALVAPCVAVLVHRLGGRRLFATAAGVVPVVICFSIWPFPLPPWLGWLLVALAALSFERAFRGGAEPDRGALVRAGMFVGLYVFTIQSSGLFYAAGATVGLLLALPRRKLADSGWFVAGGLAVAVPFVGYYLWHGILHEAVWQTLIWPNKHYYSGSIKGHYPFAGVVEYWERRGLCKVGPSALTNHVYTASAGAIPGLGTIACVASLGVIGAGAWRLVRRGAAAVAPDGKTAVLVVLAAAGVFGFMPQIVFWSLSDPVHMGFAGIVVMIPLAVAAVRGPLAWRIGAQSLVFLLCVVSLWISVHRARTYKPFDKKFKDYDGYVTSYANARIISELSEPGDTVVHMSYGGWQYLMSRRHAGVAHIAVFNDLKYTPQREFDKMSRNIRERQPTLMFFTEKGHEARFFKLDPALRGRYFWNSLCWERKDPPLPHVELAARYSVVQGGKPGDVVDVTQKGQELSAVLHRQGAADIKLAGSVRGGRVFLKGGSGHYLIYQQDDGALLGEWRGGGRTQVRMEPATPSAAPGP